MIGLESRYQSFEALVNERASELERAQAGQGVEQQLLSARYAFE